MKKLSIFKSIKLGFWDTCFVWKNEFKHVFKDLGVLLFFFGLPFGYPILYALIYNPEVVREVPMVVVDNARTPLSREFSQKMDASPNAEIVSYCADLEEAKRFLYEKKAFGILFIPSDFSRNLYRGEQSVVTFYSDMSILLNYKGFLTSLIDVSMLMNAELQTAALPGATDEQLAMATQPIPYESVTLYNPESGFGTFLIPAILMLILQQSLVLGIGMLAGGIYEHHQLRYYYSENRLMANNITHLVMGKALCYFCLFILPAVFLMHVVPHIFSYPQLGNQWHIYSFAVPYILACVFFAMTLSVFVRERETTFLLFVFTSLIFLFISGITWPTYAMPPVWRYIGYLIPSTFGIEGFVKMSTGGSEIYEVSDSYIALWIQAGGYFISTCLIYRYQLYRDKQRGFSGEME